MTHLSRRSFLGGSAAMAMASGAVTAAPADIVRGSDTVALGKLGIKTSVLGLGTGTNGGNEQLGMGQAGFVKLVRHAYDRGIRYIDTADMYKTHMFVRFALQDLPREELFIQTKTQASHPEVAKADITRYLQEMRCGYIDSLLIHYMHEKDWPKKMAPIIDVLIDAKKQGKVRSIGVSCHGMDPLLDAVGCDWIDNHLVRINPVGVKMDGTADDVSTQIAKMHAMDRGVIGMKIYGEGAFKTREERLQSLKYVLGLGTVPAFTIGFGSIAQFDETMDLIEEAAVTKPQQAAAAKAAMAKLRTA